MRVDSAYESEADAAQAVGFDFDLVDFEALVDAGNSVTATRKVKEQSAPVVAVYRGWMLKPQNYAQLFDALAERNINLINSPVQYKHCHHLPESFSLIENHTPATVSVKLNSNFNFDDIFRRLSVFGDKPLILKDYVLNPESTNGLKRVLFHRLPTVRRLSALLIVFSNCKATT